MAYRLAESFAVESSGGLLLWTLLVIAWVWGGGSVTAAKGHWRLLLVGALTGGLLWGFTAFLPARPGSLWDRRVRRQSHA